MGRLGWLLMKTPVVVLVAGFLHLELGHQIHQDHNERMQKYIFAAQNVQIWLYWLS